MDERTLIAMAQEGHHEAFLNLLSRYDRQTMSVIYRFSGNLYDREDLYQEIFLHCYKNIRTFRFECGFGTWLYRLAFNRCVSYMRKRKSQLKWEHPEVQPPPTHTSKAQIETIQRAMRRLSRPQRISFHLFYLEEWHVEEIARVLDCQPGTVKSHLQRARQKIRADEEVALWITDEN